MKSSIMTFAIAAAIGLTASADVLYWQVGTDAIEYTQAYLMARDNDNGGKLYYVSENYSSSGAALGAVGTAAPTVFANGGYALGDLTKLMSWDTDTAYSYPGGSIPSTMSFYVELYNGNTYAGKSGDVNYSSLANAISNGFNYEFSGVNTALGHSASAFTNQVPEPTSGLLMLVGLGALALRRRKVA